MVLGRRPARPRHQPPAVPPYRFRGRPPAHRTLITFIPPAPQAAAAATARPSDPHGHFKTAGSQLDTPSASSPHTTLASLTDARAPTCGANLHDAAVDLPASPRLSSWLWAILGCVGASCRSISAQPKGSIGFETDRNWSQSPPSLHTRAPVKGSNPTNQSRLNPNRYTHLTPHAIDSASSSNSFRGDEWAAAAVAAAAVARERQQRQECGSGKGSIRYDREGVLLAGVRVVQPQLPSQSGDTRSAHRITQNFGLRFHPLFCSRLTSAIDRPRLLFLSVLVDSDATNTHGKPQLRRIDHSIAQSVDPLAGCGTACRLSPCARPRDLTLDCLELVRTQTEERSTHGPLHHMVDRARARRPPPTPARPGLFLNPFGNASSAVRRVAAGPRGDFWR